MLESCSALAVVDWGLDHAAMGLEEVGEGNTNRSEQIVDIAGSRGLVSPLSRLVLWLAKERREMLRSRRMLIWISV